MRRVLFASVLALSGCNAILDIPERPLAPEEAVDSSTDAPPPIDSTVPDTDVPDSASEDASDSASEAAEDSTIDSATDSSIDSALDSADTAIVDSGTDTGADTSVDGGTDTGTDAVVDTGTDAAFDTGTDTGPPDTGPSCGVAGKPCCGVKPSTCDTNAVCDSTGSCIASTGACVRATDCTGGKVCSGPTNCSGALCDTCVTSFGTKTAFQPCSSGSQCVSGLCDIMRSVCTTPCANAISGDADCAALGSNVACAELDITSTFGDGGSVSGRLGYCARTCKHDGDCTTGEVCLLTNNQAMNRIDVTCAPPRTGASKNNGDVCANSSECKGGACLSFGGTKYCSSFCQGAADCGGTVPTCGTVNLVLPNGVGSQAEFMCRP